ncbi:MAG TPA: hypothetical protein VJZ71_00260 [Phycisphaerae bacterium]|nr:hypothetical protein [Phycisphaerae bacterium]
MQSATTAVDTKNSAQELAKWTAIGTVFQVAMVVAGHYNEFVKNNVFAIGGMTISLVIGALYARAAARSKSGAALGGLMVGGACALFGIAVSVLLRDVPVAVLGFGTAGSALAGTIGGWVIYLLQGAKKR